MPPKKTAKSTASKRTMSDEHKAAIAQGRVESRAVSRYLEALAANKPKRGRQRTPSTIEDRIEAIEAELADADAIATLNLRQEKQDLERELRTKQPTVDLSAVEGDFVAHAAAYGERKGISYAVWRKSGVAPALLEKAGISRRR
jgi:uncharacterized protein YicC (UPF0701 family)